MKQGLLLLIFLRISASIAQEYTVSGAAAIAQGGASLFTSDVFSLFNNQAGLAWLEGAEAGIFIENRFIISTLNRSGAAIALPTQKSGVFGVGFSSFGYSLYTRSKSGVAYSRRLAENVSGGVQLNYHHLRFGTNYGSQGVPTVDIGLQALLHKELAFAFQLTNPSQSKLTAVPEERIPTVLRMGFGYMVSDKIGVTSELEKDIFYPVSVKVGIVYDVGQRVSFRSGVASNPTTVAFGVGLWLKDVRIDFASQYHQVLGFTPAFNLSYNFLGNKSNQGVWQHQGK